MAVSLRNPGSSVSVADQEASVRSDQPAVDFQAALEAALGDRRELSIEAGLFSSEHPSMLQRAWQAVAAKHLMGLAEAVECLSERLMFLGAADASRLAVAIMAPARKGDWVMVDENLRRLETEIGRVEAFYLDLGFLHWLC